MPQSTASLPMPVGPTTLQSEPLNEVTNTEHEHQIRQATRAKPKVVDTTDATIAQSASLAKPASTTDFDTLAPPIWLKGYQRNIQRLLCTTDQQYKRNRELVEKSLLLEKLFYSNVRLYNVIL